MARGEGSLSSVIGIVGGVLLVALMIVVFGMGISHKNQSAPVSVDGERIESRVDRGGSSLVEEEATHYTLARRRMVQSQLESRDISDRAVLEAMQRVPRHRFVPEAVLTSAYADRPLPIGYDQTISQPYIVALMTQLVHLKANGRALDIGTGSGYQAAILGELFQEVYSIEIVEPLAKEAKQRLRAMGYDNVTVRHGDGYRGWPERAPFDAIVVAAAPDHVPQSLIDQLAPGGRLVLPVGNYAQELVLLEKKPDGSVLQHTVAAVAFVPMTGEARDQ